MTPPVRAPRSPAKVAVMAFGATILVGIVVALIVFLAIGRGHGAKPFDQGQAWGRPISIVAIIAAAIGYFVQQQRLSRK